MARKKKVKLSPEEIMKRIIDKKSLKERKSNSTKKDTLSRLFETA